MRINPDEPKTAKQQPKATKSNQKQEESTMLTNDAETLTTELNDLTRDLSIILTQAIELRNSSDPYRMTEDDRNLLRETLWIVRLSLDMIKGYEQNNLIDSRP